MKDRDLIKLLHGPYKAPRLQRGDRATCLYRDCDVVITTWTNARISWPRCRRLGSGSGSGLLIDEELLRAIRTESAEAIKYWWGVGTAAVWAWRKAFGVKQWGTEGSQRLQQRSSELGASQTRGKKRSRASVERQIATIQANGYVLPDRWAEDGWKPEQLSLLGTMPDDKVARKIGRTVNAVRIKRTRLGIPTAKDNRRRRGPSSR